MFNCTHKTNILITVCILVLLFYAHLFAYKLFFFKPVINYFKSSSIIHSVNNNGYNGTDLQMKFLQLGNNSNIINPYLNLTQRINPQKFILTDINSKQNYLIYFLLDLKKNSFDITYYNDNFTHNFKKDNISLIGVSYNIKENNVYITYSDQNNKINILSTNYNSNSNSYTPQINLSYNNLEYEYFLNKQTKPAIIKNNEYSIIILQNNNNLFVNVLGINYFFNDYELITANECIKYKIVQIESYLSVDNSFIIIALIYYCADFYNIDLKYSNLFLKINAKNKEFKLKEIYKIPIKAYNDLNELILYFSNISKENENKSNRILSNSSNLFFIILNNQIILIQKFNFENILQENYFHLFEFNLKLNFIKSVLILSQEYLYIFYEEVNNYKIMLMQIKIKDIIENKLHEEEEINKIEIPTASNDKSLDLLEIKELSSHILIKEKNNPLFSKIILLSKN